MLLLIDERERDLYEAIHNILFNKGESYPIQLEKRVLTLGDAVICQDATEKELVIIERKTLRDLVASIKDGRYEEQSYRLTHSSGSDFRLHNIMYLIEGGMHTIYNPLEKKIVLGALASIHYFKGFSLMRTVSVQESAEWIVALTHKMEREFAKNRLPWFLQGRSSVSVLSTSKPIVTNTITPKPTNSLETPSILTSLVPIPTPEELGNITESATEPVTESATEQEQEFITNTISNPPQAYSSVVKRVKNANVTPQNIGEIILCQIPSVGHETAVSVMKHFGNSFPQLLKTLEETGVNCLEGIVTTDSNGKTRKISKTCAANIHRFLLNV